MNPRPSRGSIQPADGAVFIRCRGVAGAGEARPADALLLELTGARRDRDRIVARRVRVLAVGSAAEVDRHPAAGGAARLDLLGHVLLPGLVNAHAHLDLTHVGPRPFDAAAGFVGWIRMVRSARLADGGAIRASVARGVDLALAGGVVAVGDVAGAVGGPRLEAWEALAASPLVGVSYLEFFAIGTREEPGIQATERAIAEAGERTRGGVRLGLQPHAPYTVSPAGLAWAMDTAARLALPLSIHLAESPEEHRVVAAGDGPFRRFLEDAGIWSPALDGAFGASATPVAHLARAWADSPRPPALAAVHVNDASERDLEALAGLSERLGLVVVYCPRASEYFRHVERFGPHPYRRLMAAGVPVALGTDSAINLPPGSTDGATGRISTLDEMRLLRRRDGTAPDVLLAMATTTAARALGLPPEEFELTAGAEPRGIVAVEVGAPVAGGGSALAAVLDAGTPPKLLVEVV
ncbi:MAG: amidohydrolase family protein [Phycisphaerae bacterium]|nr:amidohydrolase family protein [Phycisphaerae bacterium]